MTAIDVQNLNKQFVLPIKEPGLSGAVRSFFKRKKTKTVDAVHNISFQIDKGELVGFLGPNGAGKTTTMKMLSGLLYPSSGKISILGHNPSDRNPQFQRQFSMVMGQRTQLWWDLPARETFRLNQKIFEIPDDVFNARLQELIDLLELQKLMDTPVKKLSLGERMKSELACALLHQPKVVLLDEPTLGLDLMMQKKLREFILQYNQRYESTILLTSHNMDDVETLCKRVIIINDGRILYDGNLSRIVQQYAATKLVSIHTSANLTPQQFVGILGVSEPLEIFGHDAKMKISRDNISETIARLLAKIKVDDLSIEELPIEEIIRKMFETREVPSSNLPSSHAPSNNVPPSHE